MTREQIDAALLSYEARTGQPPAVILCSEHSLAELIAEAEDEILYCDDITTFGNITRIRYRGVDVGVISDPDENGTLFIVSGDRPTNCGINDDAMRRIAKRYWARNPSPPLGWSYSAPKTPTGHPPFEHEYMSIPIKPEEPTDISDDSLMSILNGGGYCATEQ